MSSEDSDEHKFEPYEVFERSKDFNLGHLFSVCCDILANYHSQRDRLKWIDNVEPGRLLDALRLYLGLTPEAR